MTVSDGAHYIKIVTSTCMWPATENGS